MAAVRRRLHAGRRLHAAKNEHIRIDIVNSALPQRVRDWIDLLGHLFFLMPFVLLML